MQRQQILELQETDDCNSKITLSGEVKAELDWWVQHLHLANGRSMISAFPQVIIANWRVNWRAICQGHRARASWTLLKSKCHINVLELKVAKFAIMTFNKMQPSVQSIHLQIKI